MAHSARCSAALLCLLAALSGGAARAVPEEGAAVAAEEPAQPPPEEGRACARGGRVCVSEESFAADVCRIIEAAAAEEGLDAGFFARLLWRESLFDPGAVSHAGAQGIAQFMPGTAELRGLADPFNPAEAILASADYLRELDQRFGNLGLAAAAYNAGEARVERYLAGASGLPGETRAYVLAITGHPAEAWRDGPEPEPDLALDPGRPFRESCLDRAEGRGIPELAPAAPVLLPWGVILAAQATPEAAERQLGRVEPLVAGERIDRHQARLPGQPGTRHVVQVGRPTREEAEALCARLRQAGAACMVLRN